MLISTISDPRSPAVSWVRPNIRPLVRSCPWLEGFPSLRGCGPWDVGFSYETGSLRSSPRSQQCHHVSEESLLSLTVRLAQGMTVLGRWKAILLHTGRNCCLFYHPQNREAARPVVTENKSRLGNHLAQHRNSPVWAERLLETVTHWFGLGSGNWGLGSGGMPRRPPENRGDGQLASTWRCWDSERARTHTQTKRRTAAAARSPAPSGAFPGSARRGHFSPLVPNRDQMPGGERVSAGAGAWPVALPCSQAARAPPALPTPTVQAPPEPLAPPPALWEAPPLGSRPQCGHAGRSPEPG